MQVIELQKYQNPLGENRRPPYFFTNQKRDYGSVKLQMFRKRPLIQGVPKKMSLVIFGGITSLYLIKGSNFLQWVEKQSYYINRSIYLTKRLNLNRSASRDT